MHQTLQYRVRWERREIGPKWKLCEFQGVKAAYEPLLVGYPTELLTYVCMIGNVKWKGRFRGYIP